MRILVCGYHNPHYATITEYIERAIDRLGHARVSFDDRRHIVPGRLRARVPILQAISLAAINGNLVRTAKRLRPELVLVLGGHRISKRSLQRLAGEGLPAALWTNDPPRATDIMPQTAPFYTKVFCQGTEYEDHLRRAGVCGAEWLPMGCDPELHRPAELSAEYRRVFANEIAFVGSWYPNRAQLLGCAARHPLAVWGPGWDTANLPAVLRARIRGAHTPPDQWTKIYSASKITLSIHYLSPDPQFPAHQASTRVFEAMACGAFVLTDRQKDVLALFRDGEHLACFSDGADLDRKIAYYLEHADERLRIAAAGRAEVLRHHTYAHRVSRLLQAVDATASSHPRPGRSDTHRRGTGAVRAEGGHP
jgi:spore maturation protein CgeB